jgi:hypothetical protein
MGEQGGRLLLTVIIDAGDMIDESLVEEAGPGAEFHCWERVAPTALPGIHGTVSALHERIGDLEAQFKQLSATVLGDFEHPKISLISILQDFENRLRSLKQEANAPAKAGKSKK